MRPLRQSPAGTPRTGSAAPSGPRRRSTRREAGYVLIIQVLMLGVLMTMTALAVDVGGFYSRAAEVQKAADAAALAAVVWMPDDVPTATSTARAAAARNGFEHGTNGVTVTVSAVPGNSRQVKVAIVDPNVETVFGKMIRDSITIRRDATAEYILSVPLGSPSNLFGNQALGAASPNFWAAVNGPYTLKASGDPYATRCDASSSATSCNSANAEYRNSGYLYAVEVPAGAAGRQLTVEIFDAGYYDRNSLTVDTGDYEWNSGGPSLEYQLFEADSTPLDNEDNPTLNGRCSSGPGRLQLSSEQAGYKNNWTTLCTFTVVRTGIYPLRVKSGNISGYLERGNATAQYSLRSSLSGAGAQSRLYGLGDMSIFTSGAGASEFYLAEVNPVHAGKTFEVELFDPGDGNSGNYYLEILRPDGSVATCRWTNTSGTFGSSQNCRIQTRSTSANPANKYNGLWLSIRVDLPASYTCASCWWKVRYDFGAGSQPTDRTTWRASILGDPVHLVE